MTVPLCSALASLFLNASLMSVPHPEIYRLPQRNRSQKLGLLVVKTPLNFARGYGANRAWLFTQSAWPTVHLHAPCQSDPEKARGRKA